MLLMILFLLLSGEVPSQAILRLNRIVAMMRLWSWRRAMSCWLVQLAQAWLYFGFISKNIYWIQFCNFVWFCRILIVSFDIKLYKCCIILIFTHLLDWRTGKTLLAKTLARVVNVPFAIADATALTQAGLIYFFWALIVLCCFWVLVVIPCYNFHN